MASESCEPVFAGFILEPKRHWRIRSCMRSKFRVGIEFGGNTIERFSTAVVFKEERYGIAAISPPSEPIRTHDAVTIRYTLTFGPPIDELAILVGASGRGKVAKEAVDAE